MQLYYLIEKYETERIRFQHTEIEKFSQNVAKGYDTYSEAKKALQEAYDKFAEGREVVCRRHGADGTLCFAEFREPEFREDNFGHRSKSKIEIFIAKPVF